MKAFGLGVLSVAGISLIIGSIFFAGVCLIVTSILLFFDYYRRSC
jgi:hypothetical protein